jgi:steroid delta-isomerase-like uncharacterized protein
MPFARRRSILAALAGALALAGVAVAHHGGEEEIVADYMAAWNAHDAVKAASFFAADGVYLDASVGTPQVGPEAARKNVIQAFMTAAPDCVWKREGALIVGEGAVAFEWTFSGTNTGDWGDGTKATGKPFSFKGATILRVRDGKIAFQGDYYDALGFYKQIGLM